MPRNSQVVEEHLKYYEFLEALRKSGQTNMFGAAPYLCSYFEMDRVQAIQILSEWMQNYEEINKRWDIRQRVQSLEVI